MRKLLVLLIASCSLQAATNCQPTDVNSGSIVLRCTEAPFGATIEFTASETSPGTPDWSKLHPSVDTSLFAGSNLCSFTGNLQIDSTTCKFVLGRYGRAQTGSDGRIYALSLVADRLYYVRVTGSTTWTGTVTSGHLYAGRAYLPFVTQTGSSGMATPGKYAYPTPDYKVDQASTRNKFTGPEIVDPVFTTTLRRITGPGQVTGAATTVNFATAFSLGAGTGWSTPLAAIDGSDRGAAASFTGDGTNLPRLVLEIPDIGLGNVNALYTSDYGPNTAIDYIVVPITGSVTGGCTGNECIMQVAISQDHGNTIVSDWIDKTFTSSSSTQTAGDAVPVLHAWKSSEPLIMPRELLVRTGTLTVDTTNGKLIWAGGAEFNVNSLKSGARIYLTPASGGTEFYCTVAEGGVNPADGREVYYSSCTGGSLVDGSIYNCSMRSASIVIRPKVTSTKVYKVALAQMTYQTSGTSFATSAAGVFTCSDTPTADTGEHICQHTVGGNDATLFAFHPGKNGGSRYLGHLGIKANFDRAGNTWYAGNTCTYVQFWKSNPKKFWCYIGYIGAETGLPGETSGFSILVGELTAGFSERPGSASGNAGDMIGDLPCRAVDNYTQSCLGVTWTTYTPTSLNKGPWTQLEAYTANYPIPFSRASSWYCGLGGSGTDGVHEFVPVWCRVGQDKWGYYGVYTNGDDNPANAGNGTTGPRWVAATPTHSKGQIRGGSLHAAGGFWVFPWIAWSSNALPCDSTTRNGCGKYSRKTTAGFTFPNSADDITVTLQSGPAKPALNPSGLTVPGLPNTLPDNFEVGDSVVASLSNGDVAGFPEIMRIKAMPDANTLVLERGSVVKQYYRPGSNVVGDGVSPVYITLVGPKDMVSDGNLQALSTIVFWNSLTNPDGQGTLPTHSLADWRASGNHGWILGNTIAANGGKELTADKSGYDIPYPTFDYGNYYEFRTGTLGNPLSSINATKLWVNRNPSMAGIPAANIGNQYGSHMGSPAPLTAATVPHATDAQGLYGTGSVFTKVASAGCLWMQTAGLTLHRKHFATMAMGANLPLLDISSTTVDRYGSTSDCTTDLYTYCVADSVNECVNGSTIGQIYAKVPYVTYFSAADQTTCYSRSDGNKDDSGGNPTRTICFSDNSIAANSVQDINFEKSYLNGQGLRGLSTVFSHIRNVSGFWKSSFFPGGEWLAVPTQNAGQRNDTWTIKVPEMPGISAANFATFMGPKLSIPAVSGAANVRVKFGYDLFGLPSDGYCTSRKEVCYAVNSTVNETNPFLFGSELEESSGVPCASGCEITLPIPSGMTAYYTVQYFDAMGTPILTRGIDVAGAQ